MLATLAGIYGCQPKSGSASVSGEDGEAAVEAPSAGTAADRDATTPEPVADTVTIPGEWSLDEKAIWAQIYEDRTQYLNLMNTSCGSSVVMKFDHEAFRDLLPAVKSNRQEDWNASAMINEIRNLCLAGATQKTAVATRIATIKFVRAPGRKHQLKGKKLLIALDVEGNPREQVNAFAAWLPSQL